MKTLAVLVFMLTSVIAVAAQDNKLTPEQLEHLGIIKNETEKRAARVALSLAATARKIYANMLAEKEDPKLRKSLARDLHKYAGELLDIKGQSFRDALAVLTPAQRQLVREEMKKPDAPADLGEAIERVFGLKKN